MVVNRSQWDATEETKEAICYLHPPGSGWTAVSKYEPRGISDIARIGMLLEAVAEPSVS